MTLEDYMNDNDYELIDMVMKVGQQATKLEATVDLYIRGSDDNELSEDDIDNILYSDDVIIGMMLESNDITLYKIAESFRDFQAILHDKLSNAYGV